MLMLTFSLEAKLNNDTFSYLFCYKNCVHCPDHQFRKTEVAFVITLLIFAHHVDVDVDN
jgi:hypothetical protein